jgi:hypothetical protein
MGLRSIDGFQAALLGCAAACLFAAPASAADASAGKALFAQRCSVCHTAEPGDNGGAQGPSLIGLMGRPAASEAHFSYTDALRNSKLTWNAATLQRFLSDPAKLVPGTSMVVSVPNQADRDALIAYFQSVAGKTAPQEQAAAIPASTTQSANWRLDAPGRMHQIDVTPLPSPFATPSTRNSSSVVPKPANAELALPPGFHVDVFDATLTGPRKMLLAPNGDIFVTEMRAGRVTILHPSPDGRRAERSDVYLQGLKLPFGMAFYPNAEHPAWLYVAETNRVTRYAFRTGDLKPRSAAEIVVAELPNGSGHSTRDIAFSPDGKQLFVSVGSGSNVAESMPKRTPAEIKSWEAEHGLGAAWGEETDRAAVLELDARSPGTPVNYANGIRNCVSLTVQPANGALWCTTNERDALGDDLVPDYSTRVTRTQFYGWPWYYIGSNQDPRHKDERPDLNGKVSVPDVLYQSHSAALSMTFYTASKGKAAFPAAFVGDAIVGFHGSWNRSLRTGYKLVRVHVKNGEPSGGYEDFLTGFVVDDAHVWGRPVATVELADGSLLMSEDGNNKIFRISYGH